MTTPTVLHATDYEVEAGVTYLPPEATAEEDKRRWKKMEEDGRR